LKKNTKRFFLIIRRYNAKSITFSYDKKILESQIRRVDIMNEEYLPYVQNVIFTNGDMDPWHLLSVLKDLNDFSPAIVIKGRQYTEKVY